MIDGILSPAPSFLAGAEIALVRGETVDRPFREAMLFVRREPQLEGVDDQPGQAFLDGEDILDAAVERVGPEVVVRRRVDELRGDPQAVAGATDATFQQIANAQLRCDRLDIPGRAAERPRGCA